MGREGWVRTSDSRPHVGGALPLSYFTNGELLVASNIKSVEHHTETNSCSVIVRPSNVVYPRCGGVLAGRTICCGGGI